MVQAAFGDDHEWVAWALGSLAQVRLARNDAAEAAALGRRAKPVFERNFGAGHARVAAMRLLEERAGQ